MMTGLTLFGDTFQQLDAKPQRKGRSFEFIQQRNACIIDRFYYYGQFHKFNYAYILELLNSEFFLSVYTIQDIINDNAVMLKRLRAEAPEPKHFRQKWSHLVWPDPINLTRSVRA